MPGQKLKDKKADMKMLVVCFNCLFGMAIIGMCFSIMKDEAMSYLCLIKDTVRKFFMCHSRKKKKENELTEIEEEKVKFLARIRMLKQYENLINLSKRKSAI